MISQDQSIQKSIDVIIDHHLSKIYTSMPGIIEKVHSQKLIDVLPALKRNVVSGTGERIVREYPVIPNVPVLLLSSDEFYFHIPLKKGNPVVLFFCQDSLDNYQETDGKKVVDTEDIRRNDITDAFALPGAITQNDTIANLSETDMVIGKRDGNTEIHITHDSKVKIKASEVDLGSLTANVPVAKSDKVNSRLAAIEAYIIKPHTGNMGAPTIPPMPLYVDAVGSTASTKVKVDD